MASQIMCFTSHGPVQEIQTPKAHADLLLRCFACPPFVSSLCYDVGLLIMQVIAKAIVMTVLRYNN